MATPGRASFAGVASQARQSPSFRDIARLIVPTDREKAFKQAMTNAVAMLIVVFILVTLYAVNVVLMPFLRPLMLALLFGSFLHPMKRYLSLFFKRILKEIREDDVPILAGCAMPFSIINRFMETMRLTFCHYAMEIVNFGKTLLNGDLRSASAVCLAAMSLVIIGGDSLMNLVMCINLIIFVTDITKTDVSFSDAYLHFLMRSFGLAQFCWLHQQIIFLILPIVLFWIGLSWLYSKLREKFREINDVENGEDAFVNSNEVGLVLGDNRNLDVTHQQDASATSGHPNQLDAHPYLKHTYNSLVGFHEYFIEQMEGYIDTISSACVIGFVAFIVIFTTLYLSFQIYTESVYLIEKVSISANAILNNNPDLKSLLPDGLNVVHSILDGAVNNTYQHGREWIRKSTRQLLNNAAMDEFNTTQSSMIEKQMVEFWDRAYVLWLNNRANGTTSLDANLKVGHQPYDWERLFDALQSLNFTLCAQIFKQNWDTLVSVMDSVIKVLKGNLNLVLGTVTATLSLLIVGGNVLVNFIIDLIIFTTALFYLLCASGEQYKPIELVKSLMPQSESAALIKSKARGQTNRNEFLNSVDESINAVFTASLKMMAFHGLSTWLLHRMFELEVVYIPSVISALFGAVPFISPYWASVPACFDLWLSGQVSQAFLMLLLATIPSSFVTTAFYSEIKGAGHPYLTGLAIAGGVFVFGIEGALFGPMLLVSIRLLSLVVVYFMDIYK